MQLVLLLLVFRYAMIQNHLETHALFCHPQVALSCAGVCSSVLGQQLGGGGMVLSPSRVLCYSEDRVAPQVSGEGHSKRLYAYLSSDPWDPPDLQVQLVCPAHAQLGRNFQKQAGKPAEPLPLP